jgi:large repetitive protein
MMKSCAKCGATAQRAEAGFCGKCGAPLPRRSNRITTRLLPPIVFFSLGVAAAFYLLSRNSPSREHPGPSTSSMKYSFGTFRMASNMSVARYGPTATLLDDGRVLIAGGGHSPIDVGGAPDASAEIYDPSSGRFERTRGDMQVAGRSHHTATLLRDGRVLIAGGEDLASAELFDPKTETFAGIGNMPVERSYHTATLLKSGKVLIVGGVQRELKGIDSALLFDPTTSTFLVAGTLTANRREHSASLLSDGRVLIAGGSNDDPSVGFLNTAEIYDPSTGGFSLTGMMLKARSGHTATVLPNGSVLISGGTGRDTRSFDVIRLSESDLFDPATGRFTPTGSMVTARSGHTATLLPDGLVLIVGGTTAAELYDPSAGAYFTTGGLDTLHLREAPLAILLKSGDVLVLDGSEPPGATESAEIFSASPH